MTGVKMTLDAEQFYRSLKLVARGTGVETALVAREACKAIRKQSLSEVPRDTTTLAHSFSYRVRRHGNDKVTARLGYGLNGDPVNPETGKSASEYMMEVHEDLSAYHPVGKAKFFEDPLRDYEQQFVPDIIDVMQKVIREAKL